MNILDLPDLKSGETYATYSYRLLNRASTKPLRLIDVWWTGNRSPSGGPLNGTREIMAKVGIRRRHPLITRVERVSDGTIRVQVEGREEALHLPDGDQITVEVA